jgi:hypothetical protein
MQNGTGKTVNAQWEEHIYLERQEPMPDPTTADEHPQPMTTTKTYTVLPEDKPAPEPAPEVEPTLGDAAAAGPGLDCHYACWGGGPVVFDTYAVHVPQAGAEPILL